MYTSTFRNIPIVYTCAMHMKTFWAEAPRTWLSAAAATARVATSNPPFSHHLSRIPRSLPTSPFCLLPLSPLSPTPPLYPRSMYEPHLVDFANQHSHDNEGMSLLEELDKIAPIKSFDAFPKVRFSFFFFSNFQPSTPPPWHNA